MALPGLPPLPPTRQRRPQHGGLRRPELLLERLTTNGRYHAPPTRYEEGMAVFFFSTSLQLGDKESLRVGQGAAENGRENFE